MTTLPPSGQAAADKPPPAPHLEIRRPVVPIRDLIHPNLREPLKSQQQVTFRLVKAGKNNIKNFKFERSGIFFYSLFLSQSPKLGLVQPRSKRSRLSKIDEEINKCTILRGLN